MPGVPSSGDSHHYDALNTSRVNRAREAPGVPPQAFEPWRDNRALVGNSRRLGVSDYLLPKYEADVVLNYRQNISAHRACDYRTVGRVRELQRVVIDSEGARRTLSGSGDHPCFG